MTTRHRLALALVLVVGTACVGKTDINSQIQKVGGVPLSNGSAHVQITGAQEVTFDAPLEKAQVGTVVTVFLYQSSSDDVFTIAGTGVSGTARSSTNLTVAITTGALSATSIQGECTIKVSHGEANSVNGTTICTKLDSNQGSINVQARFSAAP